MNFLNNAQDCLLVATTAPIHVGTIFHAVLCFNMHRFGPEMQSKKQKHTPCDAKSYWPQRSFIS